MLRIKHKQFNLYLRKFKKIKRGKLAPLGEEFTTNSLEEITKFYHDSDKGNLKGKLIIENN
jgi:hypothetical protein